MDLNLNPSPPRASIQRKNSWPPYRTPIRDHNPRHIEQQPSSFWYINQPAESFLSIEAVQDAFSILRLNMDEVFELRRKISNKIAPLSEKSPELTLAQVIKDVLKAVQLQRLIGGVGATAADQDLHDRVSPSRIMPVLDQIGIPKCHQGFVENILLMPNLSYYSFIILMSLFFNPAPLLHYSADQATEKAIFCPKHQPLPSAEPRYRLWILPSQETARALYYKDLPTFGDMYINHPREFLTFEPVKDAISTLRLNQDIIYQRRREFHGNKNVSISSLPFEPLSKISGLYSLEDAVVVILEAILRTVQVEDADFGVPLEDILDYTGIPKCHQSFMEKFLSSADLNYYSFLILMNVYFDLRPL